MSTRYSRADDAEWERQKETAPQRYSFTRDQLIDALTRHRPSLRNPGSVADAIIEALGDGDGG